MFLLFSTYHRIPINKIFMLISKNKIVLTFSILRTLYQMIFCCFEQLMWRHSIFAVFLLLITLYKFLQDNPLKSVFRKCRDIVCFFEFRPTAGSWKFTLYLGPLKNCCPNFLPSSSAKNSPNLCSQHSQLAKAAKKHMSFY